VDTRGPTPREARPVASPGDAPRRQLVERGADLLERQAHALSEHDEGYSPEHGSVVATMTRSGTLRRDQASILVEAKRRRRDPTPLRDLADREQFIHRRKANHKSALTSSSL